MEAFVYSCANPITPHWYLSILPFWSRKLKATENLRRGIHVVKQVERPSIGLWDVGTNVNSIAVSPYGERIVSGSDDETVRIWNSKTGDLKKLEISLVGLFKATLIT